MVTETNGHTSNQKDRKVVLASSSPRRRKLMKALELPVIMFSPSGGEGFVQADETPSRFVTRLSLQKSRQAAGEFADAIIVGADTAIVLDGEILGKPSDGIEATQMLARLRGRVHQVVTGVTALDSNSGRMLSTAEVTTVIMRDFLDTEIADYVASGDPMDKAGGYAVQNETFHPALEVKGCYLNVVGLPICEVISLLKGLDVEAKLRGDWQTPAECIECPLNERQGVFRL